MAGEGNEDATQKSKARIWHIWLKCCETAAEIIGHALVVVVLLVTIKAVHAFYNWLHPDQGPIFGPITMSDVFHVFDNLVIIGILYLGNLKVLDAYRR